ncbi:MAG: iron-containing alcohol dehydrogenase [Planctomycetota bacterium]
MRGFRMPTRVEIEPGCAAQLAPVLHTLDAGRVVLVCDPGLEATPWPTQLRASLKAAGIASATFADVPSNPRTTTAEAAAARARQHGAAALVALGGGSAIDAAKAAAVLATNQGSAADFAGRERYTAAPLPLVALPTTCGTGSEVTWVSVLTDEAARTKISLKGEAMFPAQALVDADLLGTLPDPLVAWTGLDAVTHALEATTCRLANPVSDALAERALALLLAALPDAVGTPGERRDGARAQVMRGATLAGMAFGNADVAAVHCLSEALGGRYDVHHGLANAILLVPVFRRHRPHVDPRLAELAVSVFGADPRAPVAERAEAWLARLEDLAAALAVPSFTSLGIDLAEHAAIADAAAENGSNAANPRPMTATSYAQILTDVAEGSRTAR